MLCGLTSVSVNIFITVAVFWLLFKCTDELTFNPSSELEIYNIWYCWYFFCIIVCVPVNLYALCFHLYNLNIIYKFSNSIWNTSNTEEHLPCSLPFPNKSLSLIPPKWTLTCFLDILFLSFYISLGSCAGCLEHVLHAEKGYTDFQETGLLNGCEFLEV